MVRVDSFVPNGVTVMKTIGIRILHFSYVFPVIQTSPKRTFNLEYTVEHHHISNYIPTRFTVQNQAGSAGLAAAVYCCLQLLPIHIPHHMYRHDEHAENRKQLIG